MTAGVAPELDQQVDALLMQSGGQLAALKWTPGCQLQVQSLSSNGQVATAVPVAGNPGNAWNQCRLFIYCMYQVLLPTLETFC